MLPIEWPYKFLWVQWCSSQTTNEKMSGCPLSTSLFTRRPWLPHSVAETANVKKGDRCLQAELEIDYSFKYVGLFCHLRLIIPVFMNQFGFTSGFLWFYLMLWTVQIQSKGWLSCESVAGKSFKVREEDAETETGAQRSTSVSCSCENLTLSEHCDCTWNNCVILLFQYLIYAEIQKFSNRLLLRMLK